MEDILKLFLPLYLLLFFFLVFLLRTILVSKQTGKNAYVLLKQDGVHGVIGFYFKLLPLFSLAAVVIYAFFPASYPLLGPLAALEYDMLAVSGILLLLLSLIWIWLAQTDMGRSWRIGIDIDEKTELRTNGLFTLSRNPIFLGMKVNLLGFFLVLPNALTLTILVTGVALIDIQVALEEAYLEKTHGDDYRNYCKRVRRWL